MMGQIAELLAEVWKKNRDVNKLEDINEALRARIAELEAENFKLAAGQCVHPKGIIGDDYGNAI